MLLIGDLGSALLTAETAVDLLDEPPAGGVRVLDVPIVEGGVAAAVAAESGDDLDAVIRAATGEPAPEPTRRRRSGRRSAESIVVLADPEGLHARPAAALVRLAAGFDARVTINGADASSLLRIIALGLRHGERVTVRAEGDAGRRGARSGRRAARRTRRIARSTALAPRATPSVHGEEKPWSWPPFGG